MSLEEIKHIRQNKLEQIKQSGINPYPAKATYSHTLAEVESEFETLEPKGLPLQLVGRLMSMRGQGAIIFCDLFDGTARFQILFKKDEMDETLFNSFREVVDIGDFVAVTGNLFITKSGQHTLKVSSWNILSKAILPLPEKWHGIQDEEERLRKRYLDILTNEELATRFRLRSKFWNTIRQYLLDKNFIEVETPVLENTTGGADARPFQTHHNALDMEVFLRISAGELWQKRLMVAGLPRTFEIGRIFRNEGMSNEHAQDYTQLEYYMAYADYTIGMEMTKELYTKIAKEVFGKTVFTIRGFEVDFEKEWEIYDFCTLIKDTHQIDPLDPSLNLQHIETALKTAGVKFNPKELNIPRGIDMLWKTIRKTLGGPGFLIGVPVYLEPLAKRSETNGDVVERFQVILAGSEMGKGFSELNDPIDQRGRFEEQQSMRDAGDEEAQMADFEYVEALEHGMPPTFGFGVSERLFSFLLDVPIREAQLFPLLKPKTEALSKKQAEALYRSKKFVVIADPTHGYGVTANALGQLGISIGGFCNQKIFETTTLVDKDQNTHYVDGLYPMTNLAGSQAEIASFVQKCFDAKIQVFDFSMIMRKAHNDKEMIDGYKELHTKDIPYIAVGALVPQDFEKEFLQSLQLFS